VHPVGKDIKAANQERSRIFEAVGVGYWESSVEKARSSDSPGFPR
jgi:hypothetical protein